MSAATSLANKAATDSTSVVAVAVDPDLARRLTAAGRKTEEWKNRRDDLIREAALNGGSLREVAALVGLSNPGVLRIIRRGGNLAQHITPVPQGGSADDPDNIGFVSRDHNPQLGQRDPES